MTDQPRTKPVINLDEVVIDERPAFFQPPGSAAEKFGSRSGMVGARIGARLLGYNITAVEPGKRAFPLHNHHANEEMFYILQGTRRAAHRRRAVFDPRRAISSPTRPAGRKARTRSSIPAPRRCATSP